MTATYQNNFKKVLKNLAKNNQSNWHFDPRAYPYHEEAFVHDSLWHGLDPWKDAYSSPLTHVNLYQVTIPEQVKSLSTILVRDGLFTWLDFLNRCPDPKKIPAIFLVHACLKDYVPKSWRSKVVFFEFEYRKSPRTLLQQKNSEVILKANITDGMFDYDFAVKQVLKLKRHKYTKIHLLFLSRSNPLLTQEWDNDYRINKFVVEQAKFLNFLAKEKIDYDLITWKEYFHYQGLHQFTILDLNYKEKYYIDDSTNYFFMKKGVTPFEIAEVKGDKLDHYVPLSAYHGVRILNEEPAYNSKRMNEIEKNLELMNLSGEKCDVGAFEMINEISEKRLPSSWFKIFY